MYPFVSLVGLLTGSMQYVLLRRHLPRMGGWVLATVGGWLLGWLLILMPSWLGLSTVASPDIKLIFIVMGLSIGGAQWLLLRRRLPQVGWWVAANILGWGLLSLITGDTLDQFGLLALGFLPSCATAVMLALLLNLPYPTEPKSI